MKFVSLQLSEGKFSKLQGLKCYFPENDGYSSDTSSDSSDEDKLDDSSAEKEAER